MSSTLRGRQIYDSGTVAAGAVITTPMLDLEAWSDLLVIVTNASGVSTRALTLPVYHADGTTLLGTIAVRTVAISSTEFIHIGPCALATGITAAVSVPLPARAKLSLAAAGSSNARLTVVGR